MGGMEGRIIHGVRVSGGWSRILWKHVMSADSACDRVRLMNVESMRYS